MTFPVTLDECIRNSLPPPPREVRKFSLWLTIPVLILAFLAAKACGLLDLQ